MSEQTDEVHQALGEKVRAAITVASEIAEVVARSRMDKAREAQAAAEGQRSEIASRLRAERDGAMPVMRQPWDTAWWRRAEPQEIAHVWQVTAGWSAADDPYAKTTLEHMRRQVQQRYGVTVPDQPVPDKELAMLLARPDAERAGPGAGNEPELAEGAQVQYEYVVRDAANPDAAWLAQGTVAADPGAAPADVAVQGLRQYAQGATDRGATRDERIDRLLDAAYGRVSPARDLSNVVIDVYPAGRVEDTRSSPLYSLEGVRVEEVRAEQRAERQRVIGGKAEASDEEVLAAIALEERATREDLRYERARAAAAGREPGQQVTWSISQRDFVNEADVSRHIAEGADMVPPGMSPELFAAEQLMHRVGVEGRVLDSYSILVRAHDGSAQLAHIGGEQVEAIRAAQRPAYDAARAAGAGVDVRAVEQAQVELAEKTAAAQERMGDLRLRREMAEARLRGESDQSVMWAERLRQDLDEGWWETASPAEIAGVWEHVSGWPEGAGKSAAQAQLWAGVQRMHGAVVPPGASAGDVAAALEKARDAQEKNLPADRDEDRLRQRSQDEEITAADVWTALAEATERAKEAAKKAAEPAAAAGEPEGAAETAAHAVGMEAAAAQDRQAAAALASMGDREAADAVAVAAQGFSGTPSSRLAASQGKKQSRRPRPKSQSRDQERGRGGR